MQIYRRNFRIYIRFRYFQFIISIPGKYQEIKSQKEFSNYMFLLIKLMPKKFKAKINTIKKLPFKLRECLCYVTQGNVMLVILVFSYFRYCKVQFFLNGTFLER